MKSSEQQPRSEIDIDAAKKYLDEAYGPEKATITVDKSILAKPEIKKSEEPVAPKATEKKPVVPEAKEKPAEPEAAEKPELNPLEATEEQPTAEDLAEKTKQDKTLQEAQIESAKNELIDLAKSINEAREKKETKTEYSLYDKAKEVFEVAIGKSLEETAKEKAKIEAESEGLKIISKKEFLSEKRIKDTQETIKQRQRSGRINEFWRVLPEKEKDKYINEQGQRDVNKFAVNLETKRQELNNQGILISADVFYEMIARGDNPDAIRKKGFFGRKIEIGNFSKGVLPSIVMSKKDFENWVKERQESIDWSAKEAAQEELEKKVIDGQRRWRGKKQRHTREIIQETAVKYEEEKKLKVVKLEEETKKPKIEIVSRIGRERTPEQMKEMEKIRKQVEADIKKQKEVKKRIDDLIKRQKKGELLTAKEVAYLRAIELGKKNRERVEK